MPIRIVDFTLYKLRYKIAFFVTLFTVLVLLFITLLYVPGALRAEEINSALTSSALSITSIDPQTVVNLPYHIMQRLSFILLGVTPLSIKLPSVILAGLTAIGIFVLVKNWFRQNVAVIVTIVATTTIQFLFLSQDGTPSILFTFVTIWLLVSCLYMTRHHVFSTFWKVIACGLTATAFYIPLGAYVVLALFITAALHPHIRYMIRKIARIRLVIATLLGLVAIAPLIQAVILNPAVGRRLLGLPGPDTDIIANILTVSKQIFGFTIGTETYLTSPLYSLGLIILICVGIYKYLTVKYTARSYTVLIMGLFITPFVFINPSEVTSLYPLVVMAIAMGISTIVGNWYRLFPRNPYARIAGLLPIGILIVGLVLTGTSRYMNNYTYNSSILGFYSNDLKVFERIVAQNSDKSSKIYLITSPKEHSFYALVAHYDKRFVVNDDSKDANPETVILTNKAYHSAKPASEIHQIVTNRMQHDSDRFYIYKTNLK